MRCGFLRLSHDSVEVKFCFTVLQRSSCDLYVQLVPLWVRSQGRGMKTRVPYGDVIQSVLWGQLTLSMLGHLGQVGNISELTFLFSPSTFAFEFHYLTYSAIIVSGVEFSDSSLTCNTQCPPHQVPPSSPSPI